MKNTSIILLILLLFSCGKESAKKRIIVEGKSSVPPYDTIAIDSFSQGATSVDIAAKIRMSSRKFQDSLTQIKLKNEEERLLKKASDEKQELEKKMAEAQKKKEAENNKTKDKSQATSMESTVTP